MSDDAMIAANNYFDRVVKSRFIEMFGNISINDLNWPVYKMSDLFDLQMGKTPARNNLSYWKGGNNSWVSISDLPLVDLYIGAETKEKITDLAVIESKIKHVPEGTVLMSFKLSIGRTAITTRPVYTNEAIMALIPHNFVINNIFLSFLIRYWDWSKGTNKAVKGITLNKKTLQSIFIPIPPIELQNQFSDFVKLVDKTRKSFQKFISLFDESIESKFIEMFGDPKFNKSNLVKIKEIGKLTSGGTPSRSKPEYYEGKIKWYSAGELNSLYLPDSIEHITQKALQDSSAKLFKKGTLLIGMYDTAALKMGILTEDSSSNQACANLEPIEDYNVIWLYYVLNFMKPIFLNKRQGVRQKNLSLSLIKEFQIPTAPIEMQEQFALFVEQINIRKIKVINALIDSY